MVDMSAAESPENVVQEWEEAIRRGSKIYESVFCVQDEAERRDCERRGKIIAGMIRPAPGE